MSSVHERIVELLALPENWDTYGGAPISPLATLAALRALDVLRQTDPIINPSSSGGVVLEWYKNGIEIEILIGPDGKVVYE